MLQGVWTVYVRVYDLWVLHWQFFEDVFQAADFPGGLTAKWSLEDAKRVREGGYTELDVELALDCEDGLSCFGMGKQLIAYSY